jgi:hypothetical protein
VEFATTTDDWSRAIGSLSLLRGADSFFSKRINNHMVLIFSFFALRYLGVVTSTVSWYELLIWVAIIKILEKTLGDEKSD